MTKNYYNILGIERNSNTVAVRKAYRTLALKLHPDTNPSPDAHNRFIDINEAYEVLKNPKRKHQYDRLYDYNILNKKPKSKTAYQKGEKRWYRSVNKFSETGKRRGQEYSHKSYDSFAKRPSYWLIVDPVYFIIDLIWSALDSLFN